MAYDFAKSRKKKRKTTRRKKKTEISTRPVWFGTGLACGLFAAFLFQLVGARFSAGGDTVVNAPTHPALAKTRPANAQPMGPAEPAQPRFEFYEVLPGQQMQANRTSKGAYQTREELGTVEKDMFLQAGSFAQRIDAESRRANITLLNMAAEVEKVRLTSGELTHRIYVGPYDKRSDMIAARVLLSNEGIESLPIGR